ncbi:hypothetical protein GCM10010170_058540 [Dactylosporangium salmoneum]|uniref:Uncharacterized protein n=1 Tax=Dactylosporangium salmoneum TaxID=53361 RepID=A0ABP5TV01_9ACTN
MRVRSIGTATASVPAVTVTVGRGERPAGFVAAPPFDELGPGQEREYRVPVTIPAPAYGTYTVHGQITATGWPAGPSAAFHAVTTTQPWGRTTASRGRPAGIPTATGGRARPLRRHDTASRDLRQGDRAAMALRTVQNRRRSPRDAATCCGTGTCPITEQRQ